MKTKSEPLSLYVLPRESMSWKKFVSTTPKNSIALDGFVLGGPRIDTQTNHFNYDHHEGVIREVTMSTAMQVYFAIKGGLFETLSIAGKIEAQIYINDTDQDASFAVWLLLNYKKFEGTQSIPSINRLLALNDRWDITGGAFPMNLDDQIVRQHNWVFEPYTRLRKSGDLATASAEVMEDNLCTVLSRLNKFLMGQSEEKPLDIRHEILYESPLWKIINEIGGNEARYYLFSKGMNSFVSLVSTRNDGRKVYTIGKRSQYIKFPLEKFYSDLNAAEGLDPKVGWGGSNIVGGSSRQLGSGLEWTEIKEIINNRLSKEGLI